ncbi:MAG: TetR family transcriptional regulator C-terminal domain-containing protein [Rhodothermales bacterium]
MNIKHDKNDIIAGGEQLFRANGYHNTGIKKVLTHCNIPKGSFYNFFPSKEAFALQVISYYGNRLTQFISQHVNDKNQTPLERLRSFYYNLIAISEEEQCSKGCLVYNMSFELAGTNDDIAKALDVQFENWLSLITQCIEEGQQAGEITDQKDAYELASVIHTAVNGAYGRVKMKGDAEPMRLIVDTLLDFMKA